MIHKQTVLILGAGASQPYGFPTGWGLLTKARAYTHDQIVAQISPCPSHEARALCEVLRITGDKSIDAMLEGQQDIREAGKAFISRWLLNDERAAAQRNEDPPRAWYRELFDAMKAESLEQFSRNPLTIITYNYDRSLDNFLVSALVAKYRKNSRLECANALACIGPWHLHGQLGALPDIPVDGEKSVAYGGDANGITDSDLTAAACAIRIIDEANLNLEVFARARDAIASADRVVFLGFSFGELNVRRLRLTDCLRSSTELFASAMGFKQTQHAIISARLAPFSVQCGAEDEDVMSFLQRYHQVLQPRSVG